jgi:hypothetical protein
MSGRWTRRRYRITISISDILSKLIATINSKESSVKRARISIKER